MYVTVNSSKDLRRTQNEEEFGHSVLLLRTLRAPCLGAPGQLIAGGAGARPDHSISGSGALTLRILIAGLI